MPPQRVAHCETLDFAARPRDSMSPDLEQDQTIQNSLHIKAIQGRKKQTTDLGRRIDAISHPSSTTSTPVPASSGSELSAPLAPRNFSCPQCLIPDNDPFVHYGGVWLLNVGPQSSTSHSTTSAGSSVSLKFNGSGIVVFGTVPASNDTIQPPSAVYFLDNNPPFPTTLPRAAMDIPHQALFATQQQLSDDEHHIVINITKVSAPYTLSGFFIFPNMGMKDMEVGTPTGGPLSNSTKSQNPSSNNSSSAVMQQTSSSSGNHHQTSQKSVKILAAVLAVIGFLLLIGGIVFLFWRRTASRRRKHAIGVPCPEAEKARPDTVYTSFTTSEAILQNDGNFWSPYRSHRSNASRSEGRGGSRTVSDSLARRSTIDFAPPPLPPKATTTIRLFPPLPPLSSNPG